MYIQDAYFKDENDSGLADFIAFFQNEDYELGRVAVKKEFPSYLLRGSLMTTGLDDAMKLGMGIDRIFS